MLEDVEEGLEVGVAIEDVHAELVIGKVLLGSFVEVVGNVV